MAGLYPPAIDASDEWLTQQQVAAELKVTVVTIRSKIDRGELPAYRFGPRVVRVRRSDVEKLLTPIPVDPKVQAAVQKAVDEAPRSPMRSAPVSPPYCARGQVPDDAKRNPPRPGNRGGT